MDNPLDQYLPENNPLAKYSNTDVHAAVNTPVDTLSDLLNQDAQQNPIVSQTPAQKERGQAFTESALQGFFGAKPSRPDLQAKYPVQSFATQVASGLVPFAAPGSTLLKFTGIPAAHEIIRQATTPEENLNPTQRAAKVGTSGAFGFVTGKAFQSADLLKTVAQRVLAKGTAGGATSFADSLSQDAISGKDPDLHAAVANAALNSSLIGLLGAAVEIPSLRSAIVQEGSRWAGKPVSLQEAKKILTSGGVNPEQLSPNLQAAVYETKKQALMKSAQATASQLGVPKQTVLDVLKGRTQQDRLQTIDEQINDKIKMATGRLPVFDWRVGLDYEYDYSKMNPAVAEQIKTLIQYRKQIAAGADPADILWNAEVFKRMNVKHYISESLKQNVQDTKAQYAKQIASAEQPQEKPTSFFNPGKIETVGAKESLRPYRPDNTATMAYMPYLQRAIENVRMQAGKEDIPDATAMNHIQRDELLKDVQMKIGTSSNEADIVADIQRKISPEDSNPTQNISVVTSHQGKEDAARTVIYDWRNLRNITIAEYASDLKQLNIQRKTAGLPEIDPLKDIVVHRAIYKGQQGGVAKQVREAIIREYRRTKLSQIMPAEPVSLQEPAQPNAPVPIDVAAQQAGNQAAANLSTPLTNNLTEPNVGVAPTSNTGSDLLNQFQPIESTQVPISELTTTNQPNVNPLIDKYINPLEKYSNAMSEIDKILPVAEKLHEQKRQKDAKVTRKVVENLQTAEDLAKLAENLPLVGTPEERIQQLANAAGVSVKDIEIILKPSAKAEYEPADLEIKDTVETELFEILGKLEDWYESINEVPLESVIEEESARQTKEMRRQDAKTLFKQKMGYEIGSQEAAKRSGELSAKDQAKAKWLAEEERKRTEGLAKMKKELQKHRSYLGKVYLEEIDQSLAGMSEETKDIVKKATASLEANSDTARVLFATKTIKDAIRESQAEILEEKRKQMAKQGQDLIQDNEVDKDYREFVQENPETEPSHEEKYDGDDKPWMLGNQSGQTLNLAKLPVKIKILRHTQDERDAPMFVVFKTIREFPFLADLRTKFLSKTKLAREESDSRNFFKVPGEAQNALFDTAMYLDATRTLAQEDLQPIFDDVLENVKAHMKSLGIKVNKDSYQERINAISSLLLPHASEQVIVKAYDPNNYGFSQLGQGPHASQSEMESYVKHVKMAYDYFKIPQQDRIPDADLQKSRQPVFWNLLSHPNVMNNDSLKRAVLFWKAQLEQPALDAQIKEGIYSNADVVKNYIQGYHRAAFVMKGAQVQGEGFYNNPLSGIQRPQKKYRSHAEFVDNAEKEGMIPVNDWFKDNFDYLTEAMAGVKQAQLLKYVGKIKLPRIEYESKDFVDALAKNPSPYTFSIVQHSTDANIISEAQRMGQLLGKEVTPHRILQEGGWKEGNAEWGLNKWYRGGFAPPFIYKPFAEQIKTIFRNQHRAENLLAQTAKFSQHLLTLSGLDNLTYLSGALLERPSWQVVPYIAALPARASYYFAKGLVNTGPKMAKGEMSPKSVANNEYERGLSRMYAEAGSTATLGFTSFMRHMIDMNDRGLFPQRQSRAENMKDWYLSAFGSSHELIGQMIAHDILQAMIKITENEVAKGRSLQDAVKFTSVYMNNASWNIHRSSYQGAFANFLQDYLVISRNFLVNLIRIPMIIARETPGVKQVFKKTGAANFKTSGGAGGALGEFQNVLTGADIPEEYMPAMAWKYVGLLAGLAFWQMFLSGIYQYSIAKMHNRPDKENIFDNPEGASGKVWLGVKDPQGHDVYANNGLFKMINNMASMWAPLHDPMANFLIKAAGLSEEPHVKSAGPVETMKAKLGTVPNLVDALTNRSLYDPDPDAWAANVGRFMAKMSGSSVPANPLFGSGKVEVPYSVDNIEDAILKTASLFGTNFSRSYGQDMADVRNDVASFKFKQDEVRKNIFTPQDAIEALRERKITPAQFRESMQKQSNPVLYFMRKNKKSIIQSRSQK